MTDYIPNYLKSESVKLKNEALLAVNTVETGVTAAAVRNAKWIAIAVVAVVLLFIVWVVF